jgi:hypothetical protein
MANHERGEVSFTYEGTTYTLVLNVNGLCMLEELFSTPTRTVSFLEILKHCEAGSMRHLRGLLWASLQKYHPRLTLAEVGDLVGAIGVETLREILENATASVRPDARDLSQDGAGNPRAAQVN